MTGITMLVEGKARTAMFTDDTAVEIDSAQYETGIGPCLDSFRHQKIFTIADTTTDDRWAAFNEAALSYGIRSTLSIPMVANHEGVGALNFYSDKPDGFSDADVEVGSQFGAQAAIVLANAQAYWDAHQLSQNLATAMQSRAVIEQAKGILMASSGARADEAFRMPGPGVAAGEPQAAGDGRELVNRSQQGGQQRPPTQ